MATSESPQSEFVTCHGKEGFADVISIHHLEVGRFFWSMWVGQCNHKPERSQEGDVTKVTEDRTDAVWAHFSQPLLALKMEEELPPKEEGDFWELGEVKKRIPPLKILPCWPEGTPPCSHLDLAWWDPVWTSDPQNYKRILVNVWWEFVTAATGMNASVLLVGSCFSG